MALYRADLDHNHAVDQHNRGRRDVHHRAHYLFLRTHSLPTQKLTADQLSGTFLCISALYLAPVGLLNLLGR